MQRVRYHTTILGELLEAAKKAGLTKVVQLRSKLVYSTFPIGAKRKSTLGSNATSSVSYHHFGRAFGSSEKSRVDEGRPIAFKTRFFDFPHRGKTKKHPWIECNEFGIIPPFWESFWKQRKKPGWRRSSNCVQNSFFRHSPSGRNEEAPLGSNSTRSVSYHHFGWALPSSGKRRDDEVLPVGLKTRFGDFSHRDETKKHPWDRIPRGRFHTNIFAGPLQAVQKGGLTKVVHLPWKLVFSTFPVGAKRKNTLGIEFHEVGFIPPFWVRFTKQRKTPGWRRSSNCVQNSFFRLSPSGRNEKAPLGSISTRSVSYHHFGWALRSSGKRRDDEVLPIGLKTRFFDFPDRSETKKHTWDRIPRGRFHTTILGWTYQAAEKAGLTKVFHLGWKLVLSSSPIRGKQKKNPWDRIPWGRFHTTIFSGLLHAVQKAGLTKVVQLRLKVVSSSFPIEAKRKNTLGFEFHEVGFIPLFLLGFTKQRKTPGRRRSSNCVQNSFCRVSPSGRNEKTPLRSNSTRSVSYHHFGWDLPRSGKRRVDEGRPIALKTRFFEFPHMGESKKHPLDRIPRGRFHTTILGGIYQGAENAGLTKVVQLRWKLVFSSFPIWANRKNTLWIEFHEVGFTPPFWVGFSQQRKKPGWRRSSNCVQNSFFRLSPSRRNEKPPLGSNSRRSVSYPYFCWALPSSGKRRVDEGRPIAFKTRFVEFPHRGETKKHPCDRIPRGRFQTTILGGIFQGAENAGLTKVVQLRWKLVFSSFPIWANRKNTLWIEFHEVGFTPPFWVGFSQQRKKQRWRRSSNCVQNSFFRLSPSRRNEKPPLGSNSRRSVSYPYFCWALPSSGKRRVDQGRPIGLKTRFVKFPHRDWTKKHPWDQIPRGRFHTTIFAGLLQAVQKGGLTNIVQLRWKLVFSNFPIGAKRKNTLWIEFHEVGFIPPFWVGFSQQRKTPSWRKSSNCVQNSFFRLSPSGQNEKTPLGSNSTRSVSYHHFGVDLPSSGKRWVDEGRPIAFKTRFFEIPHRGETKKHPWDRIPRVWFQTTILGRLLHGAQKASCVVHRVQCTVSSAQSTVYRV